MVDLNFLSQPELCCDLNRCSLLIRLKRGPIRGYTVHVTSLIWYSSRLVPMMWCYHGNMYWSCLDDAYTFYLSLRFERFDQQVCSDSNMGCRSLSGKAETSGIWSLGWLDVWCNANDFFLALINYLLVTMLIVEYRVYLYVPSMVIAIRFMLFSLFTMLLSSPPPPPPPPQKKTKKKKKHNCLGLEEVHLSKVLCTDVMNDS